MGILAWPGQSRGDAAEHPLLYYRFVRLLEADGVSLMEWLDDSFLSLLLFY